MMFNDNISKAIEIAGDQFLNDAIDYDNHFSYLTGLVNGLLAVGYDKAVLIASLKDCRQLDAVKTFVEHVSDGKTKNVI